MVTRREALQRVMAAAAYADDTFSPYSGGETAETLIALGASRDELDEMAAEADGYGTDEWVAQFRASARTVARTRCAEGLTPRPLVG